MVHWALGVPAENNDQRPEVLVDSEEVEHAEPHEEERARVVHALALVPAALVPRLFCQELALT